MIALMLVFVAAMIAFAVLFFTKVAIIIENMSYTWGSPPSINVFNMYDHVLAKQKLNFASVWSSNSQCIFSKTWVNNFWLNTNNTKVYTLR